MTELRLAPLAADLKGQVPTGETHDLVELLFSRVLSLINECTPSDQPSDELLRTAVKLLEMHKSGMPGVGMEETLKEVLEKIEDFEGQLAAVAVAGGGRRR